MRPFPENLQTDKRMDERLDRRTDTQTLFYKIYLFYETSYYIVLTTLRTVHHINDLTELFCSELLCCYVLRFFQSKEWFLVVSRSSQTVRATSLEAISVYSTVITVYCIFQISS